MGLGKGTPAPLFNERERNLGVARLYEYCVWCDEKFDKDGDVVEKAVVLVEPTVMVAENDKVVAMAAARGIPTEYEDKLDRIQVAVRPF